MSLPPTLDDLERRLEKLKAKRVWLDSKRNPANSLYARQVVWGMGAGVGLFLGGVALSAIQVGLLSTASMLSVICALSVGYVVGSRELRRDG